MYGKLFDQMYDGTLATKGPWQALVTFQQFIILADQHGVVDMTPETISRRTTIPLEIIRTGIRALEKPDSASRTPAAEGRRILRLSDSRNWGWRIVNYQHYRLIRSQDERREYFREYRHDQRADVKDVHSLFTDVHTGSTSHPCSKQYAVSSSRARRRKPATDRPQDFVVTPEMSEWAIGQGVPADRVMPETEQFLDKSQAQGKTFSDWQAAWRTWMRYAVKFAKERGR